MKTATLTALVVVLVVASFADARRWTDASGKHSLEAEFVAVSDSAVVLEKPDKSFLVLPLAKLSAADQRFARQATTGDAPKVEGGPGLEVTGKGLTSAQKKQFASHVLSQYSVEVEPLSSRALAGVIGGNVLKATIKREMSGGYSSEEQLVVFDGKTFSSLPQPSTNEALPGLLDLVDKNCKIKTMADAKKVEAALDVLYEAHGFGGEDAKKIQQQGNQWIFVRGKFFKKKKGFIFTTDNSGAVKKVEYSLEIQ